MIRASRRQAWRRGHGPIGPARATQTQHSLRLSGRPDEVGAGAQESVDVIHVCRVHGSSASPSGSAVH